ncbi:uncharacterized protein LOC129761475 [Toxorhynchites rutilus septentrionalis]|uniref:uncharacterized protein LOC129761475 n=1 Tax=Toxorhynchites rutilus septentrionalis TaxID=329112 RepID=UPI00247AC582|nr:uncharacterized protein LOC129761475 [Toxorhynchites rutilus septentrionalis]XP_055615178.1 uncharacterized protein LOC129761475 [Toxorhynchites rutilus septentrionalis]
MSVLARGMMNCTLWCKVSSIPTEEYPLFLYWNLSTTSELELFWRKLLCAQRPEDSRPVCCGVTTRLNSPIVFRWLSVGCSVWNVDSLYDNVRQQIADYQHKGYAHKITEGDLQRSDLRRVWYLPLGIVLNSKKTGKVRVIWDAAAKVENVSFNSMILKGPDLLISLPSVLFKFRERQIAVSGDIKEIFHQVLIRSSDRQSQRFLWRNDPSDPAEVFVMDVATFGSSCSPCCTQFVKNLNAKEYETQYPRASADIQNNHYVDDYLDSFDTIDEAYQVAEEVRIVHQKAGFEIRNWLSNSTELISRMGKIEVEAFKCLYNDKEEECERVLGMMWFPVEDVFRFKLTLRDEMEDLLREKRVPTKKEALRLVMSVFDPLGLISMIVIHGKILIQAIWKAGTSWDDQVPTEIFVGWQRWVNALMKLETIEIPRCYFPDHEPVSYDSLELHVFVDASENAYACAAHFRIVDRGSMKCILVSSKSKVAPVKSLSIPRLELQAAVIGTRLGKTLVENHSLRISRRIFWSDSSTVLALIRSDHRRYKQYVSFRISEILSESTIAEWRWVPTKQNVADEATKWGKGSEYDPTTRWFKAPDFLYNSEKEWPTQENTIFDTSEEIRAVHNIHRNQNEQNIIDFSRFSKFERLVRMVAYVHRFITQCKFGRSYGNSSNSVLPREDLKEAESTIYRLTQMEAYPLELAIMRKNLKRPSDQQILLEKNSVLYKLSPFLDESGVVRMQSRISNALYVSYATRNPTILPKNHPVTKLLVNYYHRKYGHCNNETVVNEIRQSFHIFNLRTTVRKAAKECMWCRVYKSAPETP